MENADGDDISEDYTTIDVVHVVRKCPRTKTLLNTLLLLDLT